MVFSKISWLYFIAVLLVVLVFYYTVIIAIFYKDDIKKIFIRTKKNQKVSEDGFNANTDDNDPNEKDQFAELSELVDTIKLIIAGTSVRKYSRSDLIKELRQQISDYPQMKAQAFYVAINNTMEMECQGHHIAAFSDNELEEIWNF